MLLLLVLIVNYTLGNLKKFYCIFTSEFQVWWRKCHFINWWYSLGDWLYIKFKDLHHLWPLRKMKLNKFVGWGGEVWGGSLQFASLASDFHSALLLVFHVLLMCNKKLEILTMPVRSSWGSILSVFYFCFVS